MSELKFTPEKIGRIDPAFESTHLLHHFPEARGSDRFKIWSAVTDTGEANAMSPALRILAAEHDLLIMGRETGEAGLNSSGIGFKVVKGFNPSLRLEGMRGHVAFTGMASNPTLELLTHIAAHEKGIKVVAIEDYPGAYAAGFRNAFTQDTQTQPDRLLVMNEWAKKANLEQLPWFDQDHIIVTGQPAFDYLAAESKRQMKAEVYPKIGLSEGEQLVVWMGQKGGTKEAFEMLIDGLSLIKADFRLAIRRHPRDIVPIEAYEEIAGSFRSRLVDTSGIVTSKIGAVADKLVTIFSTEGLSSVMRGIPTLHIMTHEILSLTESPDVVVPVVEDGSSLVIGQASQSRTVIARLFNGDIYSQFQERMAQWKPDGKAGERVATVLVNVARGYQ